VGADKNIIICSKFHTTKYTKFDIELLELTQNNYDIGLTLETTLNQKVNTILIQVAKACKGELHVILIWPHKTPQPKA
jgi:hypothetical protein